MNQPLTITPGQVTSNPPPESTTPLSGINPTSTTPGINFPTPTPNINVTLDQPATLTVIYLPNDRPNNPSDVLQFQVQFVYPNGSSSPIFTSTIPSGSTTTTTTTTTTPFPGTPPPILPTSSSTTTAIVPPSNVSPQVDLPPNFQLPQNTIVVITIKSTTNGLNATGVCEYFFSLFSLTSR
jgi:hypothetical protein